MTNVPPADQWRASDDYPHRITIGEQIEITVDVWLWDDGVNDETERAIRDHILVAVRERENLRAALGNCVALVKLAYRDTDATANAAIAEADAALSPAGTTGGM